MKASTIVAAVVGIAAGVYSGIHLLIPLVFTGLAWWAGRKLLPGRPPDFVAAAAVQAGHLLWIATGLVVIGALTVDLVDIALLLGGVVWLLAKPGLVPVIVLTVYQAVALLINLFAFLNFPIGENLHRALLIHLIWRALALILLWRAHGRARQAAELTEGGV
ncbi:MAG: hypothetical protein ACREKG_02365 [Candidatus Rokuibacteriota bacterium]